LDLDQLLKRALRRQERLQWEHVHKPTSEGRPNPTDEAMRIWHIYREMTKRPMETLPGLASTRPATSAVAPEGASAGVVLEQQAGAGGANSGGLGAFRARR
jgi:hypothetical protein